MIANRRSFLAGLTLGAATLLAGPALAHAHGQRRFFHGTRKLGLQLYTLGDGPAKDLDGVLARVAQMGYREVELPSLMGHTARDIRRAADQNGLAIPSIHLPLTRTAPTTGVALSSSAQQVADLMGELGAHTAIAPIVPLPDPFRPLPGETFQTALARLIQAGGADLWKQTAHMLNERGAALKGAGIAVGYHNHNLEFAPVGDTTGFAILRAETDPTLVTFEVDIGWVAAAGQDPVAFLRGMAGRVSHLHVKDVAAATVPNFALSMAPTEVGSGKLDWKRILPAALHAGVRHFYVEQEPPFAIPREDAARKSAAFLARLEV